VDRLRGTLTGKESTHETTGTAAAEVSASEATSFETS